jgi:hypothetical protein
MNESPAQRCECGVALPPLAAPAAAFYVCRSCGMPYVHAGDVWIEPGWRDEPVEQLEKVENALRSGEYGPPGPQTQQLVHAIRAAIERRP